MTIIAEKKIEIYRSTPDGLNIITTQFVNMNEKYSHDVCTIFIQDSVTSIEEKSGRVVDDTLSTCFWMTPWSVMFDGPLLNESDSNIIVARVICTILTRLVNDNTRTFNFVASGRSCMIIINAAAEIDRIYQFLQDFKDTSHDLRSYVQRLSQSVRMTSITPLLAETLSTFNFQQMQSLHRNFEVVRFSAVFLDFRITQGDRASLPRSIQNAVFEYFGPQQNSIVHIIRCLLDSGEILQLVSPDECMRSFGTEDNPNFLRIDQRFEKQFRVINTLLETRGIRLSDTRMQRQDAPGFGLSAPAETNIWSVAAAHADSSIEVCDLSYLRAGDILIFSAPPLSADVSGTTRALQRIQSLYVPSADQSEMGHSTDLHTVTIVEISVENGPIIVHVMGSGLVKEPLSSYNPRTPYYVFRISNNPLLSAQIAQTTEHFYGGITNFRYSFSLPSFLHVLFAHTRPTVESVQPRIGSYSGICVGFTTYALQMAIRNYVAEGVGGDATLSAALQKFMPLNSEYVTSKSFADFMRRSPYYKKMFCCSNDRLAISELIQPLLLNAMRHLSLTGHILMCGACKQWIVFKEMDNRHLRKYYSLFHNIAVQPDIVQNRELAALILFLQWFVSHSGLEVSITKPIVREVYKYLCILPEFFVWDMRDVRLISTEAITFANPTVTYKVDLMNQLQKELINFVTPVLFGSSLFHYVSELEHLLLLIFRMQNTADMTSLQAYLRSKNPDSYVFRALLDLVPESQVSASATTVQTSRTPSDVPLRVKSRTVATALAAVASSSESGREISAYEQYLALLPTLIAPINDIQTDSIRRMLAFNVAHLSINEFKKLKARLVETAYRILVSAINGTLSLPQAIELIDHLLALKTSNSTIPILASHRFPSPLDRLHGTASVKIVNEIKHVLQTMSALITH